MVRMKPTIKKHSQHLCFAVLLLIVLSLSFALPVLPLLRSMPSLEATMSKSIITSAEPPELSLTYYSRLNDTKIPVESGARIAGDHITLNATWLPGESVNGTQIVVNATAIPNAISAFGANNTVEIDTRQLGNNATCLIKVTAWLLNGSTIYRIFNNVFLGNFFKPRVTVLSPNGGEVWSGIHNITWIAMDKNADELLTFEVHLSSDNGSTFQLLASNLTSSWLLWDFSVFQNLSTYIIEVRVFDGIYESYDTSDAPFRAGSVNPTTSPSETSSTHHIPAGEIDAQLPFFIAAAIIASALLSLIVYQQAKDLA